jgi:tight adherence protein B
MNWSVLPYAAAAIAGVALVEGIYYLFFDSTGRVRKQVDQRLLATGRNAEQAAAADLLRRRPYTFGMWPWMARLFTTSPIRWFDNLVISSGMGGSPDKVMLWMTIVSAAIMVALSFSLHWPFLWCLAVGVILGVALSIWFLIQIRRRRLKQITVQLPDALDMLVRSLRAGHPVSTGIGMIAEEMPDPIGGEFTLVYDEMSYGLDLRQALEKMGDRLQHPVIDYLIVAMRVQYGTGGNLAEILSSLSDVLRERLRLRTKVNALSAESRLSGRILSILPIAVVILLAYINPHFYDDAWTSTTLASVLVGAGVLLVVGVLLLRHFVNSIR